MPVGERGAGGGGHGILDGVRRKRRRSHNNKHRKHELKSVMNTLEMIPILDLYIGPEQVCVSF